MESLALDERGEAGLARGLGELRCVEQEAAHAREALAVSHEQAKQRIGVGLEEQSEAARREHAPELVERDTYVREVMQRIDDEDAVEGGCGEGQLLGARAERADSGARRAARHGQREVGDDEAHALRVEAPRDPAGGAGEVEHAHAWRELESPGHPAESETAREAVPKRRDEVEERVLRPATLVGRSLHLVSRSSINFQKAPEEGAFEGLDGPATARLFCTRSRPFALIWPRSLEEFMGMTSDARAEVEALWPELAWIADTSLREATTRTWERALAESPLDAKTLDEIPFTLLVPECPTSFMAHKRCVVHIARRAAEAMSHFMGAALAIDLDVVIAGAILADVGKLLEYELVDGRAVQSERGRMLRHPFTGVALAMSCGVPDAVCHVIAAHAGEGELVRRTTEALIVHHADFMAFEPYKNLPR